MVVDEDFQHLGGLLNGPGKTDVGIGGTDVSRGVVVDEDQGRGLPAQGRFQDLSRIDHGLVDDTLLHLLHVDKLILGIEINDTELLVFQATQAGLAVVDQFGGAGDLSFRPAFSMR